MDMLTSSIKSFTPLEHASLWLPPVMYIVFVRIVRWLLQGEASKRVLAFRNTHNLVSSLGSAFLAVAVLLELRHRPLSPHGLICSAVSPAPTMVICWYGSKFYEWIDSVMLVAAGKELSSLHYNHHLTTATVVASHVVGMGGGGARSSIFDIPMLLNAGVHALMYAYYWNPQLMRPIRQWVTRLQIVQHVTVLFCVVYTLSQPTGTCDISLFGNWSSFGLYGMYLVQFVYFYISAYGTSGRTSKGDTKAAKDN